MCFPSFAETVGGKREAVKWGRWWEMKGLSGSIDYLAVCWCPRVSDTVKAHTGFRGEKRRSAHQTQMSSCGETVDTRASSSAKWTERTSCILFNLPSSLPSSSASGLCLEGLSLSVLSSYCTCAHTRCRQPHKLTLLALFICSLSSRRANKEKAALQAKKN